MVEEKFHRTVDDQTDSCVLAVSTSSSFESITSQWFESAPVVGLVLERAHVAHATLMVCGVGTVNKEISTCEIDCHED